MTNQAARLATIQVLKAHLEAARRLTANARTRRDFSQYKRLQAYWSQELEKITV